MIEYNYFSPLDTLKEAYQECNALIVKGNGNTKTALQRQTEITQHVKARGLTPSNVFKGYYLEDTGSLRITPKQHVELNEILSNFQEHIKGTVVSELIPKDKDNGSTVLESTFEQAYEHAQTRISNILKKE